MGPSEGLPSARTMLKRLLWLVPLVAIVAVAGLLIRQPPDREALAAVLAPAPTPPPIDGDRAYKYLKQLCDLGPRPAGSAANAKQRELVSKHFASLGAKVREQPFSTNDPRSGQKVFMANLIGSWNPDRRERVVIAAHYDTRPFPDEEPDPARRSLPFLGANDGASGVALLMELAHHMEKLPTPWGVDLVLFDGEELVYGGGRNQNGEYFLGSKAFSSAYDRGLESRRLSYRYVAGIVLDMVGDRDLSIPQERNSLDLARGLVRDVWTVARQLKASGFVDEIGTSVLDDHLAMNNAGIPTIDLIDFDYPYWHTSQDLPEKCSGASLAQVGKVVASWLSLPKRRTR